MYREFAAGLVVAVTAVAACASSPDYLSVTVALAAPYVAADAPQPGASSTGLFECHGAGPYADLGPLTTVVIVLPGAAVTSKDSAKVLDVKRRGDACEFHFAPLEVPSSDSSRLTSVRAW